MSYTGFIAFKLKALPDDFQVREIVSEDFKITDDSSLPYAVFRLTKSGWNTVDLLDMISRQNGIKYASVSYGGKKDRHALTEQLVTVNTGFSGNPAILKPESFLIKGDKWTFERIGFADRPFGPDLIESNEFTVTIRSLHGNELPILANNYNIIKKSGLPNYFDDQRFGGYDPALGFTAAHILNGDYEKALFSYMTFVHSGDKGHAKKRKYGLREIWGDWEKCQKTAVTGREKKIFSALSKNSVLSLIKIDSGKNISPDAIRKNNKEFYKLLEFITKEDLSMYFAALQSWIWNDMLCRQIIRYSQDHATDTGTIKLGFGDLVFDLSNDSAAVSSIASFDVPGPGIRFTDPYLSADFADSMLAAGVRELKDPGLKAAYLKGFSRNIRLLPTHMELGNPEDDDFFKKGRKKIKVSFRLNAGSYATMVIKRLTLRTRSFSGNLQAD